MSHTFKKTREGNRRKMIYYAPQDVREFVEAQAVRYYLSKSEVVVQLIQESWSYKRREIRKYATQKTR